MLLFSQDVGLYIVFDLTSELADGGFCQTAYLSWNTTYLISAGNNIDVLSVVPVCIYKNSYWRWG